ncbi:MAG: hypothetical protein GY855_14025, partial [candidate division Zixibacteria bacterium]|nr:hypothetical protein [candidate division Zixibacteria bacterium]
MKRILTALVFFILTGHSSVSGFQVMQWYPPVFSLRVQSMDTIMVIFDDNVDPGSVNQQSFIIRGEWSGNYSGSYLIDSNTVRFIPSRVYGLHWGEKISVTLTDSISSGGASLDPAFGWQFFVKTPRGLGVTQQRFVCNPAEPGKLLISMQLNSDTDNIGLPDLISIGPGIGRDFLSYWLNNYNGGVNPPFNYYPNTVIQMDNLYDTDAQAADFNNDGRVDLIIINEERDYFYYLINQEGGGVEIDSVFYDAGGYHFSQMTILDVDQDGWIDLGAISSGSNKLAIFRNLEGISFDQVVTMDLGDFWPSDITASDFNGDHFPDLAICAQNDGGVVLFLNQAGSGNFIERIVQNAPYYITGITSANADGNRFPDLLIYSSLETGWKAGIIINPMNPLPDTMLFGIDPSYGHPVKMLAADLDTTGPLDHEYIILTDNNYVLQYWDRFDIPNHVLNPIGITDEVEPPDITVIDFDSDGDLDFMVSYESNSSIIGYRNEDNIGECPHDMPDIVDFGIVEIDSSTQLSYWAYNVSEEMTILQNISGFNSVFSLIDYIQGDTLWPGDSTLITVAFEPPEYESYTDTIIHEIRSG